MKAPIHSEFSGERDHSMGGFIVDRGEFSAVVRRLSKISNLRAATGIVLQWLIIVVAMSIAIVVHRWWLYVLCAAVIASRQHALGVIMHDATHFRLFSNRRLNDLLSDWFCAFPIGLSTEMYRKQHLEHHQFTNTDKDPYHVALSHDEDWDWPKDNWECIKLYVFDVFGLHIHIWFLTLLQWSPFSDSISKQPRLSGPERIRFLIFCIGVLSILIVTNGWLYFLGLWVLPALTFLGLFFRIRTVAEHMVLEGRDELDTTRHVDGTALERFFIAPLNINYHLAHHLFPSVPWYNLPEMHRMLMADKTIRRHSQTRATYFIGRNSVLREIISR